jgi:hypothetical protein
MAYRDVCRQGRPVGGRVRQDDVNGRDRAALHDAGGVSPGLVRFIEQVIRVSPMGRPPPKPHDFPSATVHLDTYPGRGHADVHFEGRAVDVFLHFDRPADRIHGEWLFDWCVANAELHGIQGVIFGPRQWFSEKEGGAVHPRPQRDHDDHVHIELNCEGANLRLPAQRRNGTG